MLYKILGPERISVLERFKIRFTQPEALNDPFESMPMIDILDQMTSIIENIKSEAGDLWSRTTSSEQTAENYQLLQNHVSDLVSEAYQIATGQNPKVSSELMKNINLTIGILSLSKTIYNLLMWSHYADSHRGYAIGFDSDHPFFHAPNEVGEITHPHPVIYTSQRSTLRKNDHNLYAKLFCEKPIDWAYEEEYRILRQFSNLTERCGVDKAGYTVHLVELPKETIRSVYIGAQAKQETTDKIVNALTKINLDITLYKMSISPSEYRLIPKRIAYLQ